MAITNAQIPAEGTMSATGNQDDFDFGNAGVLLCANSTLVTLRGLAAGRAGQHVTVVSVGAGQVDLSNEDSNSSAANRIINGVTGTISLAAGSGRADLVYDSVSQRWRVMNHEQGAWITPAYNASDFTGQGSMTWTVDAGDVVAFNYRLSGRTLTVNFSLSSTSVGGVRNKDLFITIPGGFTTASEGEGCVSYFDNGTRGTGRMWANGVLIALTNKDFVDWSLSTNNTVVSGQLAIEVQ